MTAAAAAARRTCALFVYIRDGVHRVAKQMRECVRVAKREIFQSTPGAQSALIVLIELMEAGSAHAPLNYSPAIIHT